MLNVQSAKAESGIKISLKYFAGYGVTDPLTDNMTISGHRLTLGPIGYGVVNTILDDKVLTDKEKSCFTFLNSETCLPKAVSRKIEATSHEFSLTVDALPEQKPHKVTIGYGTITGGFYKFGKEETKITSGNTVFVEFDYIVKYFLSTFGIRFWDLIEGDDDDFYEFYVGLGVIF